MLKQLGFGQQQASPLGEVAEGRRGVVYSGRGEWDVGSGTWGVVRPRIGDWLFGSCIANNPHPGPPQGEGALLCSDLTVDSGRGMDPGSRALRALGRGYELLFSFSE